jgi:tRNA pseudouridine55 synthase
MDGVLVVDKPVGPTSHDVVARVRRAIGERRIGHTGTLDPAACGVLPLVIGRATRLARFLSASDKRYEALIRLGFSTSTGDAGGEPASALFTGPLPSRSAVEDALNAFRGTFLQQPPAYSAKKIDGRRSYKIARAASRRGAHTLPEPVPVTAHAIDITSIHGDVIALRVECSAGFYVRSLAHDLGESLGTGGHLIGLQRTAVGDFGLPQAVALATAERNREATVAAIVPMPRLLLQLSSVVLTVEGTRHAVHGRDLGPGDFAVAPTIPRHSWVRLLDQRGDLVGVARPVAPSGLLHPAVVLI